MTIYPFFIHAIFMSIFASVIGPFGGFFASGFKRAFKIKVSDRSRSYTRFGDSDLQCSNGIRIFAGASASTGSEAEAK